MAGKTFRSGASAWIGALACVVAASTPVSAEHSARWQGPVIIEALEAGPCGAAPATAGLGVGSVLRGRFYPRKLLFNGDDTRLFLHSADSLQVLVIAAADLIESGVYTGDVLNGAEGTTVPISGGSFLGATQTPAPASLKESTPSVEVIAAISHMFGVEGCNAIIRARLVRRFVPG